jgi:hypothetical protein
MEIGPKSSAFLMHFYGTKSAKFLIANKNGVTSKLQQKFYFF